MALKTFARMGDPKGIIDSFCDNQIAGNGDDATGEKPGELCTPAEQPAPPPPPPPPAEPTPAPSTTGSSTTTTQTVEVEVCKVPDAKGVSVAVARRLLRAANCELGAVKRRTTKKRRRVGKVIGQSQKPGTKLAAGTPVAVTVGKRARK